MRRLLRLRIHEGIAVRLKGPTIEMEAVRRGCTTSLCLRSRSSDYTLWALAWKQKARLYGGLCRLTVQQTIGCLAAKQRCAAPGYAWRSLPVLWPWAAG